MNAACTIARKRRQQGTVMVLSRVREYPKISVYLGAAGLILQLVAASAIYILSNRNGWLTELLMGPGGMQAAFITMGHSSYNALLLSQAATLILVLTSFVSIILLTKGTLIHVRIGSLVLMVAALLSATTTFGLILGGVLMFVAGLGGLIWAYNRTSHL